MKKVLLVCLLFVSALVNQAMAQDRTVTGTVISEEDDFGLPGVNVALKGAARGAQTDVNGKYSITVPNEDAVLIFTFVGMQTQEVKVGAKTVIDVTLAADVKQLQDVVVTALGVSREKRALGYSVQEVNGDDLAEAKETNIVNSLSGKVAGVQITSANGMGGSSRILIRGANSLQGENQPLFVIDGVPVDNSNFTSANQARGSGGYDYGNAVQDINPEDIESMTILKGGSAAALYGNRAANGVIVITTKKGSKRKGIGVSVNSGVTFEDLLVLPEYQNLYGGGSSSSFYTDVAGFEGQNIPDYATDESWGPRLDGTPARQWYSFDKQDPNYGKQTPWVAHPNNIRDFFNLGTTYNNNVALSGGNDKATFRLSYTNMMQTGIFPNSKLERNTVSFSGDTKLSDKLSASITANYVSSGAIGRPGTGYDGNNVMQQFNQWGQRQVDMSQMINYKNPDGSQRTWNRKSAANGAPKYSDNPYWVRYENYQNDNRERFYGNLSATYKFNEKLQVKGRLMTDYYTDRRHERIAVGSQAISNYTEGVREVTERVSDVIASYNTKFGENVSFSAIAGMDTRTRVYNQNIGTTVGGLSTPNFYSLENAQVKSDVTDRTFTLQTNGIFASTSFGYKSMLFLDLTARQDWSSTLPKENNSYFYPSATSTFVFSELPALENSNVLSFGKVRAAYAIVGNATDPYRLADTYLVSDNFGSKPANSVSDIKNNPNLKPERTYTWEVGTELKFFQDRVGLDFTYYQSDSKNQIIELPVSPTTGYSRQIINAGLMTNKGIELALSASPVRTNNFNWDVRVNVARNRNKVVSLGDDISNLRLANAPFAVSVNAYEGQPYGTILGYNYVYDDNGNKITEGGYYKVSDKLEPIGNVMADFTGGIQNSFSYKGISVSALVDFQVGGDIFSTTNMWGNYSGILAETAATNANGKNVRDAVEDGGGVLVEGVNEDGTPNTTYVPAQYHFYLNGGYVLNAANVYDASFVKLRELRIGYSLPKSLIGNLPFTHIRLSAVGRNLAILFKNVPNIDPESATNSGNVQGIEGAALPSTKTYGFKLSFGI